MLVDSGVLARGAVEARATAAARGGGGGARRSDTEQARLPADCRRFAPCDRRSGAIRGRPAGASAAWASDGHTRLPRYVRGHAGTVRAAPPQPGPPRYQRPLRRREPAARLRGASSIQPSSGASTASPSSSPSASTRATWSPHDGRASPARLPRTGPSSRSPRGAPPRAGSHRPERRRRHHQPLRQRRRPDERRQGGGPGLDRRRLPSPSARGRHAAIAELGFSGPAGRAHRGRREHADVHHVVVCTLCSCYPWPVLGLPPSWYKDPAYRARVVREPRALLAEMGFGAGRTTSRSGSGTAARRSGTSCCPSARAGTEDLSEDELARARHP